MLVWGNHFIMATIVVQMASPSLMRWPWIDLLMASAEEEQWRRRFSNDVHTLVACACSHSSPTGLAAIVTVLTHLTRPHVGCCSVTFVDRTPIFDWCVVRRGSKNKHHEDTCSEEIGLRLHIFINSYFTFSSRHDWEDLCVQLTYQQTCTFDNQVAAMVMLLTRLTRPHVGCCSVTFVDRTPIFDWCVVRRGSKNGHLEDTCFKEISLRLHILLILIPLSIADTFGRTFVSS